jgi:hypothetical protein
MRQQDSVGSLFCRFVHHLVLMRACLFERYQYRLETIKFLVLKRNEAYLIVNRPHGLIANLCVLGIDGEPGHLLLFLRITDFYD